MHIDWFLPKKLAKRLARNEVSNREVAMLMLASLVVGHVIYYGAFVTGVPSWSLLSFYEATLVVIVTFIGFSRCYLAAGGDSNDRFFRNWLALSFGVWFWTTIWVWSVYWLVVWAYSPAMEFLFRLGHYELARAGAAIGSGFYPLWTVLAAILWETIYFTWLRVRLTEAR